MIARLTGMRWRSPLVTTLFAVILVAACGKPDANERARNGDRFVEQKLFSEASIEYRAALQIDPNLGDVRLKLGDVYMRLEDRPPARCGSTCGRPTCCRTTPRRRSRPAGCCSSPASSKTPRHVRPARSSSIRRTSEAQILLGNTLAGLKDVDGAIAEYREALALEPNSRSRLSQHRRDETEPGPAGRGRGRVSQSRRGRTQVGPRAHGARQFPLGQRPRADAEQTFKDDARARPGEPEANRGLGTFYMGSNRVKEAEPYFKAIAQQAKTTESALASPTTTSSPSGSTMREPS